MTIPTLALRRPPARPDLGSTVVGPEAVAPPHDPEADARDRARGVLFMLGSALGFSVMSLCVKALSASLPTMEIVFARSVFMAVVTFGALKAAGTPVWGVDRRALVARGVAGATALSLIYWSVGRLPLGDAVTIQNTTPVWTALLAAVFLGERLRPLVLAGAAVCLTGVALVAQPVFLFGASLDPLDGTAVAVMLCGAFLSAVAYTYVRKLRTTDAPMTIIFYLSWIGVVGALPFALLGGWAWPSPAGWALLLGVGLATHTGQVCLTKGMHLLEAGTASAVGYVQVVLAFLWGAVFFGDAVDALSLAGAALVVASVLFIARRG